MFVTMRYNHYICISHKINIMQISAKNITAMFVRKTHLDLHSVGFMTTPYIAVFISPQHQVISSTSKQKESLMRIESLVSKQIHAISDNLKTLVVHSLHCVYYSEILALANFKPLSISVI